MKLPFTLGLKFVYRILLPGFVLAVALLPVSRTALEFGGGSVISLEYLFILEMLLFGWLFILLDMPIYMAFEGRRFWPKALRDYFTSRERERLERLEREEADYFESDIQRSREASVEARRFPLDDETGDSVAKFPTRLGNLLTAYEEYSKRVYGMYQGFYWPRMWVKLDKDLREEIDSLQALADSALYVVAALYFGGVVCAVYAVLRASGATVIEFLPLAPYHWLLPPACFALGYFIYRGSLHTHAQFGETFKTVFDQFRVEVKFEDVLKRIAALTHDPSLETADVVRRNMAVWRYLHNHRVKCPRCGQVILPAEAEAHAAPHSL